MSHIFNASHLVLMLLIMSVLLRWDFVWSRNKSIEEVSFWA